MKNNFSYKSDSKRACENRSCTQIVTADVVYMDLPFVKKMGRNVNFGRDCEYEMMNVILMYIWVRRKDCPVTLSTRILRP